MFLELFPNLEDVARRPLGQTTPHSHRHGSRFQDLLFTGAQVSSTADMMLNSAVAVVADTNTQGNELFVLLIEGATPEGIGFQFLYLAKGADAAEEHFRIVLLSILPDFTDILEHVYLQVRSLLG